MIDVLGHPIEVGMTVLTNYYSSASMGVITTVDKITKKAVYVTFNCVWYSWDKQQKTYVRNSGLKQIRRRPDQIIVIDKQLNYNRTTYPENML